MDSRCSRIFAFLPTGLGRAVEAGITMTVVGAVATILWFGGVFGLLAAGIVPGPVGFVLISAVFWVPLGLLSTFPVGVCLWRFAHSSQNTPRHGAVLGGLTMVCSLCIGSLFPAVFSPVLGVFAGETGLIAATGSSIIRLLRSFGMALVAIGWVLVPLGAIAGWCYERSQEE